MEDVMSMPLANVIREAREAGLLRVEVGSLTDRLAASLKAIKSLQTELRHERNLRLEAEKALLLCGEPVQQEMEPEPKLVMLAHVARFCDMRELVRLGQVSLPVRGMTQCDDLWQPFLSAYSDSLRPNAWEPLTNRYKYTDEPPVLSCSNRLLRCTSYKASVVAQHAVAQQRRSSADLSRIQEELRFQKQHNSGLEARMVRWTIFRETLNRCIKGSSIESPLFTVGGVPCCSLLFYPEGDQNVELGDWCSFFITSSFKCITLKALVWIGDSSSFELDHVFGKQTKSWGLSKAANSYRDRNQDLEIVVEFSRIYHTRSPPYIYVES